MSLHNPECLVPIALGRRVLHSIHGIHAWTLKKGFPTIRKRQEQLSFQPPSGTLEITSSKTGEQSYHFRRNSQVSENLLLKSQTETELDASKKLGGSEAVAPQH